MTSSCTLVLIITMSLTQNDDRSQQLSLQTGASQDLKRNTSEYDYICGSLGEKLNIILLHTLFALPCLMHCSAKLPGRGSYALHRCMTTCTWHIYSARKSPTFKGNSALQHIKRGKTIKTHNGITFRDCYM